MTIFRKLLDSLSLATVSVLIVSTGAAAMAVATSSPEAVPAATPSVDTEATSVVSVAVGGQVAIPVADIGVATVSRSASGLDLVSATADPGWQVLVEVAAGRELEVSFRSDGVRHDLNVELEDGELRVRVRTRAGQIEDSAGSTTSSTSTTSSSTSTSSTIPGSTSSTSTTSTTLAPPASGATVLHVDVIDAGSVSYTVDGAQLSIVDVSPNADWNPTVEVAVGREVEVSFRNNGARVDLNLELEDGQVRVRIRDRRTDTRTEVRIPVGGDSSGGSSASTTATTIPSTSSTAPTNDGSVPVEPTQHSIGSTGGTVVVSIAGNTVLLVSATPADGYVMDIRKAGPDEVDVRFEDGDAESRVEIRVQDGRVRQDVENR